MREIDLQNFTNTLKEKGIIQDCIINFSIEIIKDDDLINIGNVLKFRNCVFESEINIKHIKKTQLTILFSNCAFKKSVNINHNEKIKELTLIWHNQHKNSSFENEINIKDNHFEKFCTIENLNQTKSGSFSFTRNNFLKKPVDRIFKIEETVCKILNCNINNGSFSGNKFDLGFDFINNTLKYDLEYKGDTFINNLFQKANFLNTDFGKIADFSRCNFYGTTLFENCKNLEETELKFVACKFEKYSKFDNSKFNKIEILHSKFLEKASFENLETNYFKIHQVTFAEAAYFDDVQIKKIDSCDRKTLRAIKRELINTHNQIDYLRFKAYELEAYKKEIDGNKLNWKDSLILYFNEDSNYFGLDWTKGIRFIFQWSFIFYLLYIITCKVSQRC